MWNIVMLNTDYRTRIGKSCQFHKRLYQNRNIYKNSTPANLNHKTIMKKFEEQFGIGTSFKGMYANRKIH